MPKFNKDDQVRETYGGRLGKITGKTFSVEESMRWEVDFGNGEKKFYRESYLELIEDIDDMFALIDIGGGTVDLAMMLKTDKDNFDIVSKSINPLGIEIVLNKIANGLNDFDKIRVKLKNEYLFIDYSYINENKERELKNDLSIAFFKIVQDTKYKNVKIKAEHVLRLKDSELRIFICGGGAKHKWYKHGILRKREDINKQFEGGLKLKIEPVEKLIPEKSNIKPRFIIAYLLSQPIGEYITSLPGFPWHFESIADNNYKENRYKIEDERENVLSEKYGGLV